MTPYNMTRAQRYTKLLPEEELNVYHSRGDFLHHISYEVELVTRTGSM